MQNIVVGRYSAEEGLLRPDGTVERAWDGWIEPEDRRDWIVFVRVNGQPVVYLNRDPATGAVLESPAL